MDDRFVNQGEEVILTLLWQSGASESATVCFVISLSICYWVLHVWERGSHLSTSAILIAACVWECLCVWECEWERDGRTDGHSVQRIRNHLNCGLCVRERGPHLSTSAILIAACVWECVCENVSERERRTDGHSVQRIRNHLNCGLCVRERGSHLSTSAILIVAWVSEWGRERERERRTDGRSQCIASEIVLTTGLFANT